MLSRPTRWSFTRNEIASIYGEVYSLYLGAIQAIVTTGSVVSLSHGWDSAYLWGILIWLSLHTVPTPIACDIQGTNKVFPGSFTPRAVSINPFTAFHGLTFLNYPYSLHLLSIKVWLFMVWSGVRVIFICYAHARCLTQFDFFNKLFSPIKNPLIIGRGDLTCLEHLFTPQVGVKLKLNTNGVWLFYIPSHPLLHIK